MVAFCSCPKFFPEAKLKNSILISLVNISRLPHVVSVIWLLVITPGRVYKEEEQAGQKEIENV